MLIPYANEISMNKRAQVRRWSTSHAPSNTQTTASIEHSSTPHPISPLTIASKHQSNTMFSSDLWNRASYIENSRLKAWVEQEIAMLVVTF